MSDYDPNLGRTPGGTNRYGQYEYRDPAEDGRPGVVLLAVLAGVALVGGFLYFGNPQNSTGTEQAQVPAQEQSIQRAPATEPRVIPQATPATPTSPAAPTDAAPAAPRTRE